MHLPAADLERLAVEQEAFAVLAERKSLSAVDRWCWDVDCGRSGSTAVRVMANIVRQPDL
jgi:hypothetical protein